VVADTKGGAIFIDWETRSRCDLRAEGGWRYTAHESTEVVCGVALDTRTDPAVVYAWSPFAGPLKRWHLDSKYLAQLNTPADAIRYAEPLLGWGEGAYPPALLDAAAAGVPFVAHNAPFDRGVWDGLGLPETTWLDSLSRARRRGLPGGLGKIGETLYGLGKDTQGAKVMRLTMAPTRSGDFLDPDGPRLSSIVRYCLRDVMLLAAMWHDEGLGDPHPDDATLEAHWSIDRRGVLVDLEAAQSLLNVEAMHVAASVEAAATATGGDVTLTMLRSPSALGRWLASKGYPVEDTTSATIQELLK